MNRETKKDPMELPESPRPLPEEALDGTTLKMELGLAFASAREGQCLRFTRRPSRTHADARIENKVFDDIVEHLVNNGEVRTVNINGQPKDIYRFRAGVLGNNRTFAFEDLGYAMKFTLVS